MEESLLRFLLSLTVVVPLTAALWLFRKIERTYYPFLFLVMLSFITELIARFFIVKDWNANPVVASYMLLEYLLLLLLFHRLGAKHSWRRRLVEIFMVVGTIFFFIEIFLLKTTGGLPLLFRIGASFVLVIFSILEINRLILQSRKNLFFDGLFILCLGFIIYFSFQILLEGSYLLAREEGDIQTASSIFTNLTVYINVATNLIYAYAILFLPRISGQQFLKEALKRFDRKTP